MSKPEPPIKRSQGESLVTSWLDPVFMRHVLHHRGLVDALNDYCTSSSPATEDGLTRTTFQIQLPRHSGEALWPSQSCLFSVLLRDDELCRRRLFVWQQPGVVLCAVTETGTRADGISGTFFSGSDPFALDKESELHAIAYRRMAKKIISAEMAALVAPLASVDMGQELGRALAECLHTRQAELFLDGLAGELLRLARPAEAARGTPAHSASIHRLRPIKRRPGSDNAQEE